MNKILILGVFILSNCSHKQQLAMSFQVAKEKNISVHELDSLYQSAVHEDTSLAVFKTEIEQDNLIKAYYQLIQDFGGYLAKNNFTWDKQVRCFNRIYFNSNGKIDYFLYNFLGKTENDRPTELQQLLFDKLLNQFISDYKFPISTQVKFAQCSPVTYKP